MHGSYELLQCIGESMSRRWEMSMRVLWHTGTHAGMGRFFYVFIIGSGKGSREYWVSVVTPGRILYELGCERDTTTGRLWRRKGIPSTHISQTLFWEDRNFIVCVGALFWKAQKNERTEIPLVKDLKKNPQRINNSRLRELGKGNKKTITKLRSKNQIFFFFFFLFIIIFVGLRFFCTYGRDHPSHPFPSIRQTDRHTRGRRKGS